MQPNLSQNYGVDERYKGMRNAQDNNSGLSFVRQYIKNINLRPLSTKDYQYPNDNNDVSNISNVMNKSSNYFS
tara:strand:- start:157 stop:375 length:219 start_codon:yes stop_codon:yes gene_type:complete